MTDDDLETPLTAAGHARRDAILALAQIAASRRRRRRIAVRSTAACAMAMVALLAIANFPSLWRRTAAPSVAVKSPIPSPATTTAPSAPQPLPAAPIHPSPGMLIRRIETDSTLVTQMAASPSQISIRRLDDDQLLEQLAAAHQPAGLAYVDGQARLLFRHGE